MDTIITSESIETFKIWLKAEERSDGTIQKYIRDITALSRWLNGSLSIRKPSGVKKI